MLSDELQLMQQATQMPCISIILPLNDTAPQDKRTAMLLLEKAMNKTRELLLEFQSPAVPALLASLQQLADQFALEYNPAAKGAGLYVSGNYSRLFYFPFAVKEKVYIADTFALRELLYLEHLSVNYFVLHLNQRKVLLYKGSLHTLEPVKNHHFPRFFYDDYEYSRPAHITAHGGYAGLKSFEKDKSVIAARRLKQFYMEVDGALTGYLNGQQPLILMGTTRDIALMQEITRHRKNIIGVLPGGHIRSATAEVNSRIWPVVQSWLQGKEQRAISSFMQQKWQGHTVEGIKAVWPAVHEGKGLKLLVEKDFAAPYTHQPHQVILDAVDDVLHQLLKKKREIIFVPQDALQEHQHIALLVQY